MNSFKGKLLANCFGQTVNKGFFRCCYFANYARNKRQQLQTAASVRLLVTAIVTQPPPSWFARFACRISENQRRGGGGGMGMGTRWLRGVSKNSPSTVAFVKPLGLWKSQGISDFYSDFFSSFF